MSLPQPSPELFDNYKHYMLGKRKSPKTIKQYMYALKKIPENVLEYFTDETVKGINMKVFAYRSYIKFLYINSIITRDQKERYLEQVVGQINRGHQHIEQVAIPYQEWRSIIRKAPHNIARTGFFIGFEFGLRAGEIIHLRLQDVDLVRRLILIRRHEASPNQESWYPKHMRERQIRIPLHQVSFFKRWINEFRGEEDLSHPYLLWTPRTRKRVGIRNFQRWCKIGGIKSHDMRRSFATYYYYRSNKDIHWLSGVLGHSNIAITSEYLRLDAERTHNLSDQYFS